MTCQTKIVLSDKVIPIPCKFEKKSEIFACRFINIPYIESSHHPFFFS